MRKRTWILFTLFALPVFSSMLLPAQAANGSWIAGNHSSLVTSYGQTSTSNSGYSNGIILSDGWSSGGAEFKLPTGMTHPDSTCYEATFEARYTTNGWSGTEYKTKGASGTWSSATTIASSSANAPNYDTLNPSLTIEPDSNGYIYVDFYSPGNSEIDISYVRSVYNGKTGTPSAPSVTGVTAYDQNLNPVSASTWLGLWGISATMDTSANCLVDKYYWTFSTSSTAPAKTANGWQNAGRSLFSSTNSQNQFNLQYEQPSLIHGCGQLYLHVYFKDYASRSSNIWSSSNPVISWDNCKPTATLNSLGSSYYTSAPTLSWSGSDSDSGLASNPFTIEVNGNSVGTYPSSTTSLLGSSYSNRLTCGANTIKLTVKDASSPQNSQTDSQTLYYTDPVNCKPTDFNFTVLNNAYVNEDGMPTISWYSSTSSIGIAYYEINLGSGWVSTGTSRSYTPTSSLNSGTYTVQIRALDHAGTSSNVTQGNLWIDITNPAISSVTSSSHSSSTWSNSNSVQVSSSATDNHAGMDAVFFYLSNQSSGITDSTILSANNKYTCSGSSSCSASYTLTAPAGSSGTYYAYALARDDAETMSGNPDPNYANSIRSGALLIDMVSPSMTTAPSVQNLVNGYHGNNAVSINLGTASDQSPGSGVASFRYYVKDVSSTTTPAYQTISATSQTATWTSSLTHGTTYVACVQPVDGAGNVGNTQCSSSFIADLSTPLLDTAVLDEDGNNLTNSQTYWFANTQSVDFVWSANATSNLTAVKYQYKLQSNPAWPSSWTTFATAAGAGTQSLPTLPDGFYDLRIQAVNALGSTTTDTHVLKIDTNSPHSLSLAAPNGWRNSTSVTMSWSAMDSTSGLASIGLYDAVSQSAVSLCGAGGNQLCNTTLSSLNTASGSFALTLPNGNHSFYIVACDAVGHCTTTSLSPATAQVDLTKPSCTLDASPDGWTNNNPTINHTVQDGGAISGISTAYRWTFMGNVLDSGTSLQNGYTMTGAPDGIQTFTLTVQNGAGTSSTCSVTVFVDKTEPQTPVISGIENSPARYQEGVLLNISIQDQTSGPSEVDISINGNLRRSVSNFAENQTGVLYIEELISSVELVDGEHTVTITVLDQAGNSKTTSTNVVVDRTSPTVSYFSTVNEVLPNHQFGHDGAQLKWSIEEEHPGASVDLYVDGVPYSTNLGLNEQQFQLNLQTGTYELELRGSDNAGNSFTSEVLSLTFVVDNDAPQLTCAANGDVVMLESVENAIDELRYMQCEWEDASAIDTEPEVYVDGTLVGWDEYGSISEGITFADDLATGSHEFTVTVADVHGNTAEYTFSLDITGPELEVFFSNEPIIAGEQTVNFLVQGGDVNSREFTSLKVNGVEVDISQAATNTNLAIRLMLGAGDHEFELTVSDQFNSVTKTLTAQVACQAGTYWDEELMSCEPLPTDPCEVSPSILRFIDNSPIYYVQLTNDVGSSEVEISLNGEPLGNDVSLTTESNQLVLDFTNATVLSGTLDIQVSMDGDDCASKSYELTFSDGTDDQKAPNQSNNDDSGDEEEKRFIWFFLSLIGLLVGTIVIGKVAQSRTQNQTNDDKSEEE
jgi:hypothetical protein